MAVRTEIAMGTVVTVEVAASARDVDEAIERAFGWFREIEARCSRFDEESELRHATAQAGVAIPVSPILYEAVRFALLAAKTTDGAFDPAIGRRMETRGFNQDYRTEKLRPAANRTTASRGATSSSIPPPAPSVSAALSPWISAAL